jgi:hypothetical protein
VGDLRAANKDFEAESYEAAKTAAERAFAEVAEDVDDWEEEVVQPMLAAMKANGEYEVGKVFKPMLEAMKANGEYEVGKDFQPMLEAMKANGEYEVGQVFKPMVEAMRAKT